jgi:hypothetical protein
VKAFFRKFVPIAIGAAVIAGLGYAFMPQPVRVDFGR